MDPVDLVQELVRIPSISRNFEGQKAVQQAALSFLPNLLTIRGERERPLSYVGTSLSPTVLFACHTDTVPVSDDWELDPFSGELVDDGTYVHGRGSVDMKGGLAAAIAAVEYADSCGYEAGLLMTSDEEIGGLGASEAFEQLRLEREPQLVIIPEATDNGYSMGHRGAAWFELSAQGKAAHGSTPDEGINAIRMLADQVIAHLDEFPAATDDYLGSDSVNLGIISGGQAPNMVPDSAKMTLDFRTVAGSDEIRRWVSKRCWPGIKVDQIFDLPSLRTPSVPAAMKRYQHLGPLTYFTDGAVLHELTGNAPIVIWGPGEPDQMHTVDEKLRISSYRTAITNYCTVIRDLSEN